MADGTITEAERLEAEQHIRDHALGEADRIAKLSRIREVVLGAQDGLLVPLGVVTGMAASMGSILLSGAKKGRRLLYPHSRVLIHQPLISGRMIGPASDINIQAREMEKLRAELNQILAKASGQPLERINRDTDRDFYLNAPEAIEYGLADRIVDKV